MTAEEVIGLQDLDDAFVFAQAEKNVQADLLESWIRVSRRWGHN